MKLASLFRFSTSVGFLFAMFPFLFPASAQQQAGVDRVSDIVGPRQGVIGLPDYTRDSNPALAEGRPMIQLALLLDTSSSMDGLIAQAKSRLWSMVNAFVKLKKSGKSPIFQVALYEYGRNSLPRESGFVRKVIHLTDDLDKVSEELMALQATRISHSDERCGRVLHRAVEELGWSRSSEDLKVIYIAGNESFAQGGIDFRIPCRLAGAASISINTIFCGDYANGERLHWKLGAQLGGGSHSAIDHHISTRSVSTPQDSALAVLNAALNETFVPYTNDGIAAQRRQKAADEAALGLAESSLSERARLKATRFYQTSEWDLVEACRKEDFDLATVPEETLPDAMRKMSLEQKRDYLSQAFKRRSEIKKKIISLGEARAKYLAELELKESNTLDRAVVESLKAQAAKKKFVLD